MRTRTEDRMSYVPYRITDNPGNVVTIYPGSHTGTRSTMTDVLTPQFAKRKSQGAIIMNPCSLERTSSVGGVGSCFFGTHPVWGSRLVEADFAAHLRAVSFTDPFSSDLATYEQNALINAYAKIQASTVQGLVGLAEAGQTLAMIISPLKGCLKLLKKIRRKRRLLSRKAVPYAKAVTDSWLQYRYGWRPLMFDIESGIEAYEKHIMGLEETRSIARSGINLPEQVYSQTGMTATLPGKISVTFDRVVKIRRRVNAGVYYHQKIGSQTSWQSLAGFRLQDVPSAVWEIVPFSFVADWFVQIGPWIEAITPKPGVTVKGNWVTVNEEIDHDITSINAKIVVDTLPKTTYQASAPNGSSRVVRYSRSVNVPLPTYPPTEGKSLGRLRQADAIALLVGPLLKGFKGVR